MTEIRCVNDLKDLQPFSKILIEDQENRIVKEYTFLYNLGRNQWSPQGKIYLTNDKFEAPIEEYIGGFNKKYYINYADAEKKGLEAKVNVEHDEMVKLSIYEKYHFGFVKGKIVYFDISPRFLYIHGYDGKDVDFSVDDITSVFVRKPKFSEVKNVLPKMTNEDKDKYVKGIKEGKTTYYIHKVDGKTLRCMQNNREDNYRFGYFKHIEFDESVNYTLYCTMYEGRDDDYHYINFIKE
jgi:hypothetical protein